jgi:large subunit ribosomal protein L2
MPKRIKARARGKGGPAYRAPSHRFFCRVSYRSFDELEKEKLVYGEVIDIVHDPGRSAPVMIVRYETGEHALLPAISGIKVGDVVASGLAAPIGEGNVLPLQRIPEGTLISNIEATPGDGGKFVRSSGGYARVVGREKGKVIVRLPSKRNKAFHPLCRAMIGMIAGFGRVEKPIVKAGKKFYMMRAKGKYWPRVAAVAMNPVDHPFGGGKRRGRIYKAVARGAPPGAKVGAIAPRRVGKRKR